MPYSRAREMAPSIIAVQQVNVAAAANASAPLNAGTRMVRLCSSTSCRFLVGPAVTALATSIRLPADVVEYVGVAPGWVVSVIRETSDGVLSIAECQ
jgi:hypothetical protein